MVTWFFFAIVALSCFTIYDLLSRKLSVDSENPRAMATVFYGLVTILSPILLFLEPIPKFPPPTFAILVGAGSLVAWCIFGRVGYLAHKHVEASTLGIILKLAPVLTLFYSAVFLSESISTLKIIGIALILASNVYLVWILGNKKFVFNKGLIFALVVALGLSLGWTFDKVASPFLGIFLLTLIGFAGPAVFNGVFPPIGIKSLKKELYRTGWKLVLLAFINLFGYAALIKALMLGEAGSVTILSTATTPLVVLLAVIFLRETDHFFKKLIVAVITVLGISLLG